MNEQTRFLLNESDLPKQWYNILADSPTPPAPVLNPQTLEPVTPEFMSVIFSHEPDHAGNEQRPLYRYPRRSA